MRPRKPTRQDDPLRATHRHIVSLLNSLNCAECLGDPLGLIGKLKKELRADCRATKRGAESARRPSNRACTTLNNKIVKIVALHELKHTGTQLRLAVLQRLNLRLQSANLIIKSNPLPQCLANVRCVPRALVVRVLRCLHALFLVRL